MGAIMRQEAYAGEQVGEKWGARSVVVERGTAVSGEPSSTAVNSQPFDEVIQSESAFYPLDISLLPPNDGNEVLIRTMDMLGSIAAIVIAFPIMIAVAVLIKLSSSGPVFYKQDRVGKNGRIFTLHKFRTMVKDAEERSGLAPASPADPRVTPVGEVLRKTRLDELPQLFNVLKGDMSLVGPRPENIYRVNLHKPLRGDRLAVRPGLTGLAQIRSLYDLKPEHKIRYDKLYIQNRSVLLNLYIVLKTIPVVFCRKGW